MKILLKSLLFLILVVILVFAVAIITSDFWLGQAIAAVIYNVTGLPVTIDKANLNLRGTAVGFSGIEIKNPNGFEGTLASIPKIYVDMELAPVLKTKKLYFETVELHVEELSIVRNQQGLMNLSHIKTLKKDKEQALAPAKPAKPAAKRGFFVENLVLTVRKVNYKDSSLPVPIDRSVDLKIEQQVFQGISSPSDIVRLIFMKVMQSTSFAALGAPVDLLKQQFGSTLIYGQAALAEGAEFAKTMGTQVLGEGMKFVEGTAGRIPAEVPVPEQVGKVAEDVKGKATGFLKGAQGFLKDTTETLTEKVKATSDSSQTQQ